MRLTTVRAVRVFIPLAMANRVVDRVRDRVGPIRQPVGLRQLDALGGVDTHDTGEPRVTGDRVDGFLELLHAPTLSPGA